jgi:UDP-xylose/UDP-N-acetylglucosamine transporter B4
MGVVLTTISTRPLQVTSPLSANESSGINYAIGIAVLTGALLLSSAMGLAQDKAYAEYGRGHWEEGMFYLHFLALPMFLPLTADITQQVQTVNASPPINLLSFMGSPRFKDDGGGDSGIYVPIFWIPLIFNIATQLVCVSGVNRLTAKVSSLTVTLVLAVRKAVSLVLSVVVIGGGVGDRWLWSGSLLVLCGTMLYTWDGTRGGKPGRKPPVVHARHAKGVKQE